MEYMTDAYYPKLETKKEKDKGLLKIFFKFIF